MKPFSLDPAVQRDQADFLKELNACGVRFVVVGGWAVMAHSGKLRATKDIDIYAGADEENLKRIVAALGAFGAPSHLLSIDALLPAPGVKFSGVTFGLPPNRIDVLTQMEVPFAELEARHEDFDMRGHRIPVAAKADLVMLKQIALRDDPKRKTDRADLKVLESLLPKRRR